MKDERLKDIPVVMMSANEENEFVSTSLAKGAKDYIVKPLRTAVCNITNLDCKTIKEVYEVK